jgi:cation:H+ antiporter
VWHVLLLIVCAAVIYLSCEWFVNAVEWLGRRLNVGALAVGTVLAAFGTALPESAVTFVAVVFGGGHASKDIGVGAAMGGPLVLATIAYGVIGVMLLVRRRIYDRVGVGVVTGGVGRTPSPLPDGQGLGDQRKLVRDQTWFLVIFVVKVAMGLVAFAVKPWLGLAFFAAYGLYFWRELRDGGDRGDAEELAPLLLQRRRAKPTTWAVLVQTLASLAVIFAASQLFVRQLDAVGPMLGLPAAVTALLLSPIATELPEIMNAIIWVRQGKTPLALANVSGAMMIQATVPSGLGLLFTPWRFDAALLTSGLVTMAAMGYLLLTARAGRLTPKTLAVAAVFYLAFAACLAVIRT